MADFLIRGGRSPEMLLRLLNIFAQQDAVIRTASITLEEEGYLVEITAAAERGRLIVEKARAMVLVHSVEWKEGKHKATNHSEEISRET